MKAELLKRFTAIYGKRLSRSILNVADHAADNQGHLLNNGSSSISQVISEMRIDNYVVDYLY